MRAYHSRLFAVVGRFLFRPGLTCDFLASSRMSRPAIGILSAIESSAPPGLTDNQLGLMAQGGKGTMEW